MSTNNKTRRPSTMTLRFMVAPSDITIAGATGVSAGRVLQWIDKGAYACAAQWCGSYAVTAYVGHTHFRHPIPAGHMVEVRSRIAMTGRTSMQVVTEVASADPREGVFTTACDCLLVFVARDMATGKNLEVPTFTPETPEELYIHDSLTSHLTLRKCIEAEMAKQSYDGESTAPRLVTRFLAKPGDVNWGGKVHGGTAMEWIDEAGTACTMEWSGERTMAVYAGGIRFYQPISVGDLIEVDALMMRTDARSMQLSVTVRAGDAHRGRAGLEPAIHATMTYIGLDLDHQPLPAQPYTPQTPQDIALSDHAAVLRDLRTRYAPLPLLPRQATRRI